MIIVSTVFFVSLIGIIALFALKSWEDRNQRVLAPHARDKADIRALRLKERISRGREQLSELPPAMLHLSRVGVHRGALQVVRIARGLEAQAQRLADLVSHKHKFEKRDTQSPFLKRMRDYGMRPTDRRANGAAPEERADEQGSDRVE